MSMDLFESKLPSGWKWETISDRFRVTKKPKRTVYSNFETIPFVPMESVPLNGQEQVRFELRRSTAIASGTYFEKGDVLLSKITPSFENGKQGLAHNIPAPFGIASTEIIPLQAINSEASHRFLFFYLLHPQVRAALTGKMEGSTGRQRVPENMVRDFPMPVPPKPEQEKIAAVRGIELPPKCLGRLVAQRTVRPLFVILLSPFFYHDLGFQQTPKTLPVQTAIAKFAMKTFHMPVFPWTARRDIVDCDGSSPCPFPHRLRHKLRPIVAAHVLRRPVPQHQ